VELLSREWSESECALELLGTVAENAEEIDHITIDVVVGLDGRRFSVEQD
jgi:hypothetical protein